MATENLYNISLPFNDGFNVPVCIYPQSHSFYISCMSLMFKEVFGDYLIKLPFEAVDSFVMTAKMAAEFPGNLYARLADIRKEQLS